MKLSKAQEKFMETVRNAKTREEIMEIRYARYLEGVPLKQVATNRDGTPFEKTMEDFGPRFHDTYRDERGIHIIAPSGTLLALAKRGLIEIIEEGKGRFTSSTIKLK